MSEERIRVSVEVGELKAEVEGSAEEVLRFVISFFERHLPAYSLSHRLASAPDLIEALDALQEYLGYSESEGLYFRPTIRVLSNPERILLFLAMKRLENRMGRTQKGSASLHEMAESLGLETKALTARLSELSQEGLIQRMGRGEYQITPTGLEKLLSRVKESKTER